MKPKMFALAQDGTLIRAEYNGHKLMIGGDFETVGYLIIKRDPEGYWAYFAVRGFVLKFQDRLGDSELQRFGLTHTQENTTP